MRLEAETIRQLMEESDLIDQTNPEQLLNAAVQLINPVFEQEAPATPVLGKFGDDPIDEIQERQQQYQLDLHVLGLIKKTWDMLSLAIHYTDNPEIKAVCQREQALLIYRLLNNKSPLFSITDKMHQVVKKIIGIERYTKTYAEQLLACAANSGDMIAQFFSIRRLLLLAENTKPLQPVADSDKAQKIRQCFHSWINSNPEVKQQLSQFSYNLSTVTRGVKPEYLRAVKLLVREYSSSDLFTLLTTPAQLPLLTFLKSNISTLCEIDRAFSANWNEISLIPVATKTKLMRKKLFGDDFPLDRSQSTPRPAAAPRFFLAKKRSDPKVCLVDPETNKRARDPRDCILETPNINASDENKGKVRRVSFN